MIGENTWRGVRALVTDYASAQAGDEAIILYTSDSYEAAAWVTVALEQHHVGVRRMWMAPLRDAGFVERLEAALPDPQSMNGRLIVFTFERDTMSHTNAINAALRCYRADHCVVLRTIGASEEFFATGLSLSPSELSSRNAALLESLMPAKSLRISTAGGSNLTIRLDQEFRWISNRGSAKRGGTVILPAGEIATYPKSVDGVFVADFAYNINTVVPHDVRLTNHPVRITLQDGVAVEWRCDDQATQSFVDECFAMAHATRVGELGFGTNSAVVTPVPYNSHLNERCPGIHLGFGQHNQDEDQLGYQCQLHLDLIARGAHVFVDGCSNAIDLEHLVPSVKVHPSHAQDEDVFAPGTTMSEDQDCCGLLRRGDLRAAGN